jgi:hypothetical protein
MRKCSDSGAQQPMNTLSMSKRWVIAFQAVGVIVALAVVVGVAALSGSAAPKASQRPHHAAAAGAAHHSQATFSLPVAVNLQAVLAILFCLLALAGWAVWQRRNRCHDCGYAPVFCQCELASGR